MRIYRERLPSSGETRTGVASLEQDVLFGDRRARTEPRLPNKRSTFLNGLCSAVPGSYGDTWWVGGGQAVV